ncbi:cobalamin-dependent protein [Deltaproteobacteria bacterium OttesenSCG-928-K17]|nr:cobalamin-dependent protein [Deltaproteobacteria bacterium OttesenSCG-928-K17]
MTKKTKAAATLDDLIRTLVDLEVPGTTNVAAELNEQGVDPKDIMTACEKALVEIGLRYEQGEYFIAGLIMAGEIMNRVISLVAPRMGASVVNMLRGKVLIGTVKGDIHGLGKNIAGALLSAYGFEVKDLGVDVPVYEFVEACQSFQPDIIGLSVLLTSCYDNLGETIAALKTERKSDKNPVIFISGAQITKEHQRLYGADHCVETAFDTVRLCEVLVRHGLGPA